MSASFELLTSQLLCQLLLARVTSHLSFCVCELTVGTGPGHTDGLGVARNAALRVGVVLITVIECYMHITSCAIK